MAGTDVNVKIGIDGEAQFKKQINDCNTSIKTMGTEVQKVTSAFIGNENSAKALKSANKALTDQFDALNKKADIQRARLAELDKQGVDPTDASYQRLVQDLNKTETEMNKTSAQIDQNNEKLKNHGQTAEEAHKKHAEAAKKAAEAVAGLATALINVGVKLGEMVLKAAGAADELGTMATKTGLSVAELQKMQYAAESIDVSVETITGSMTKLTKNMSAAASGSKSAQEAFQKLGVAVTNDDGSFRDRNEVFNETIAALGQISDETERDAAAMAIFGKSAQELNPLILGGAEALQQLGDRAEKAGLIMSEEDVNALAQMSDRFNILQETVSMVGNQFLAQFAGPMTEEINRVIVYVERLFAAFKNGGIEGLASELGKTVSNIAGHFAYLIPKAVEFGTQFLISLVQGIVSQLGTIAQSAITIVTTLANSIAKALPELIPVAVKAILQLVDTLTDPNNISNLVDAAIAITMALANGLISALPQLLEKAPVIIQNLVTALIQNVPKLLQSAYEVVSTLVRGIFEKLPEIGEAAGEIIGRLVSGIAELASKVWNVGKDIVTGIWNGISETADWLWNQVKGFFGGLLDKIKEFLGIHSPSTVFADVIGKNMALGIGEGFDETMAGVERDMMSSIPVPTVDATVNGGAVAMGGLGGGVVEEITIPVMVGEAELARVLYRHIVGEGQRIGPAMVT
jgi:phage-related protein